MAASTVMPVNCICFIESDSLSKVLDRFFILEKTVPNQTASVVARSVVCI